MKKGKRRANKDGKERMNKDKEREERTILIKRR